MMVRLTTSHRSCLIFWLRREIEWLNAGKTILNRNSLRINLAESMSIQHEVRRRP